MNKFKTGVRLAKEGKMHLAYVNAMQDKEYDISDDTLERDIDARLLGAMFADLAEHKKTCSGCTTLITDEIKAKMQEKGESVKRKMSYELRRRLRMRDHA